MDLKEMYFVITFVCILQDVANFQAFFNFSEMRSLSQNFCLYHINAPGQEEGATTVPEGWEIVNKKSNRIVMKNISWFG